MNAPPDDAPPRSDTVAQSHPPYDLFDRAAGRGPGRFRAVRVHAHGGMGQVSLAEDAELGRRVALKEILPRVPTDGPGWDSAVHRFLFEGTVTGWLEHPGIVPVYGLGRHPDGRPYYAMRFVGGKSLAAAVREFHDGAASPAARSAGLRALLGRFVAVCQAVAFAHSKGVIHRDLKASNVMLGEFGETLVVDWGIAKQLAREGEPQPIPTPGCLGAGKWPTAETAGVGIGSPHHWSPESASGDVSRQDERTDVYGLGAILFEILARGPAHPDGRHGPAAPSPKALVAWVDGGLDAVTRKALSPDPADRHPTAAALAHDVERWLADEPLAVQRATVAELAAQVEQRPDDRRLREQLARQHANLGLMLGGMGRDEDALGLFGLAADGFTKLAEEFPTKPRYRAEIANCYLSEHQSLERLGRAEEAGRRWAEARQIYALLHVADPKDYRLNFAELTRTGAERDDLPPVPVSPAGSAGVDLASTDKPPDTHDHLPFDPGTTVEVPPYVPKPFAGEPQEARSQFSILNELGRGGTGAVYLARDNELGRLVAIKAVEAYAVGELGERRILREFRVTAQLEHPNIIPVYGYGRAGTAGRLFLVMRYVRGETLWQAAHDYHAAQRPLSPTDGRLREMVAALATAATAVHFAHTRGVVHRDPKPANIMLGTAGEVYVLDWGLAKIVGPAGRPELHAEPDGLDHPPGDTRPDPDLTSEGGVLGTPGYMAPEMARGEVHLVSPATDTYILGAGLFQILTGRSARIGSDLTDMLRAACQGPTPEVWSVRPDAPAELNAICARAMAFLPEDRYPSADDFAAALRAWLADT